MANGDDFDVDDLLEAPYKKVDDSWSGRSGSESGEEKKKKKSAVFNGIDELQLHQAGGTGCPVIEAGDSDAFDVTMGTPTPPIDANTPTLSNAATPPISTPEIPEVNTPMLTAADATLPQSSTTPEILEANTPTLPEEEEDVPHTVLANTQDVIHHIAGHNGIEPEDPLTSDPPTPDSIEPSNDGADASANQTTEEDPHNAESLKILASLCVDAPSNEVRDCIRIYKREKTYKQLKAAFNTCRKPVIIATLQYLGCSDENLNNHAKPDCIHKLICIIQSLLPEDCDICKETYVVQKDDPSLLACRICLQEVHYKCYQPLLAGMNIDHLKIMTVPGIFYLCPSCIDDHIPDEAKIVSSTNTPNHASSQPTMSVAAPQARNSINLSTNMNTIESESHSKRPVPLNPHVIIENSDNNSNNNNNINSNNKGNNNNNNSSSNNNNNNKSSNNNNNNNNNNNEPKPDSSITTDASKSVKVCSHYKNNNCKHGISGKGCNFVHPKRCAKLMKHGTRSNLGCNLGKNCSDFHPKMCPMSISKLECFDTKCNLCHVKGTKRVRDKLQSKKVEPAQKEAATRAQPSVSEKADSKQEGTSTKMTPDEKKVAPADEPEDIKSLHQSFLHQINLLKKEFQEVVNQRINSLVQSPTQFYAPLPPQLRYQTHPTPHLLQPYQPIHQSLMFPQYQTPIPQL